MKEEAKFQRHMFKRQRSLEKQQCEWLRYSVAQLSTQPVTWQSVAFAMAFPQAVCMRR